MNFIKRKNIWALAALLACILAAAPALASSALYKGQPAKYVFFFIGDGMGLPQKSAAEAYTGKRLVMDQFPAQGITTTRAADRYITGSAASATALACGLKTNINYIGVDPKFKPIKSVAEMAKDKGWKVGIISSVSIDHATPAAFYSHVKTRKMYHEIDHAMAQSGFDFFGGGGLIDPTGKKSKKPLGDAKAALKKAGYKLVEQKSEFMALKPGAGKVYAYNNWLQDGKALPYAMDRRAQDISLAEFTGKAIELLDNGKGFFLMVEGGKIDWACHANDAAASIKDTLAFDDAVAKAVAFYKKHPSETLILVTGDHECGGLTLGYAGTKYKSYFDILDKQSISFKKFTDEVLKKYKKQNNGQAGFAKVKPLISKYFGLKFQGDPKKEQLVLLPYQVKMLEKAYSESMAGKITKSKNPETALLYGGYEPLAVAITHLLNNKAGLGWTSYKHTGVPVATSAMGVGAASFNGYYDNTDVAKKVMAVMGVPAKVQYLSANQPGQKLAVNN